MAKDNTLPKVLAIAGSDSGGGAGIQADIKTLTSQHVYASTVITSVTSQNTLGVNGIQDLSPEFVSQQISTVLSDIGTNAIKIGMLSSAAIIKAVASSLKQFPEDSKLVVVDPVMVATSGSRLLAAEATQALIDELLPITFILTPNVPEAEVLLGQPKESIKSVQDMREAAKKLSQFGPRYILLKGGHLPIQVGDKQRVTDVLYNSKNDSWFEISNEYVETQNTHGTGCTLSSALAGELAKGYSVELACERAVEYVRIAITDSLGQIGSGNGPINHFHLMRWSPYQGKKNFVEALIDSLPEKTWSQYIDHPFVRGIAEGTLPIECFTHYLKQDYIYLKNYARAAALGAFKSNDFTSIETNAAIALHIAKEAKFHIDFCAKYGISKEDVENATESVFNSAYTRYVLERGSSGDLLDLKAAMAPCLIGYGVIGMKLFNDPATKREGNPYWDWILQYSADDYQQAVAVGIAEMDKLAEHHVSTSPSRFIEVCKIFEHATRLEISFWDMGLNML